MSAPDRSEWVDASQAARLLGVPSARHVKRLAKLGMLSARHLPGVRRTYSRNDVERLARESVRPATATPAG